MALTVDIVGPDGVRWSGQATFVSAPSIGGSIGLYPAHEPFMAVLKAGNVAVDDIEGKRSVVPVSGGFLSFHDDIVTIIADSQNGHGAK